ncbi:MAG: hypothetical protein EXR98_13320 [Gemmataceae bacterium]|nr:hypothetical protein [Gemmataceae bacterium]
MEWDEKKLLLNIRAADTDDLLDRITAYRATLEIQAIEMIERELHQRGVNAAQITAYAGICRQECLFDADGTAKMCSLCRRPAVAQGWGWHRLMQKVPVFPRWLRYCKNHKPA